MADYRDLITNTALKLGLDPKMALALTKIESNFNPKAVSPVGAQGLMQLMPETAKSLGVTDSLDPEQNATGGITYFLQQLRRFKDPRLAAAAYNSGPGRVVQFGSDFSKYPKETQNYVQKFQALMDSGPQLGKSLPPDSTTSAGIPQSPQTSSNNLFAQLMALPSSTQAPVDPAQLVQPLQTSKGTDIFNRIMGSIATLGGTAANFVGASRGNPGVGNGAVQSGMTLLDSLRQQDQTTQKKQQVNTLLQNAGLPTGLRTAVGLTALGVPESIATQYANSNDPLKRIKDIAETGKTVQEYQANTTEGKQATQQQEISKFQSEETFKNDLSKKMEEFKQELQNGNPQKATEIASSLRQQFQNNQLVQNRNQIQTQVAMANDLWGTYLKDPTAQSSKNFLDQALVKIFNKVIDPTSVVRESEAAQTPEGASYINRLRGSLEKVQSGGIALTDQDRKDLVTSLGILSNATERRYNVFRDFYKNEALKANISPDRVINLIDQPETATAGTPKNPDADKKRQRYEELLKKAYGR